MILGQYISCSELYILRVDLTTFLSPSSPSIVKGLHKEYYKEVLLHSNTFREGVDIH